MGFMFCIFMSTSIPHPLQKFWAHLTTWRSLNSHICCPLIWKKKKIVFYHWSHNAKKNDHKNFQWTYISENVNKLQQLRLVFLILAHKEQECVPWRITRNVHQNQQGIRRGSCFLGNRSDSIWSVSIGRLQRGAAVLPCDATKATYPRLLHEKCHSYFYIAYKESGNDMCYQHIKRLLSYKRLHKDPTMRLSTKITLLQLIEVFPFHTESRINKQELTWGLHYHLGLGLLSVLLRNDLYLIQCGALTVSES